MSSHSATTRVRPPESPVKPGDLVADKYRVDEVLGAGGMGVVVAAEHVDLHQPVAIKFLLQHMAIDTMVARFLREARASAKIQSEHVVRVYDCGELEDGTPYMVMERLEGVELRDELKRRGPFPIPEAVDIIVEALEGVAEAHAQGIVHRDLKPSNLFLAGRGTRMRTVKVLDFGISKIRGGPDTPIDDELTGTSMMLGSPRYISPEQAKSSRSVDGRADIWSMGVILYELLTGASPFAGNTMGEVIGKVLLYNPPPLDKHRDDVPDGLQAVLQRCLQRDPKDRYQSVSELATALEPFGTSATVAKAERIAAIIGEVSALPTWEDYLESQEQNAASPPREGSTPPPGGQTVGSWVQPSGQRSGSWRSSRPLMAAVGMVAAAAVAFWVYGRPGVSEPVQDPSAAAPAESPTPSTKPSATVAPSQPTSAPPPATVSAAPDTPPAPATASASAAPQPPVSRPATNSVARPPPPPPPPPGKPAPGVLDRSD